MTVERRTRGPGFYDFRKLKLVVRVDGKTVVDRLLCSDLRCGPGSHHGLALQNVYDGPHRGRLIDRNWGDPGYEGQLHDGRYEFITNDDRFAYRFTAFAASGMPAQVFTIDPTGRLVEVTKTRLDLVRKDARQWWGAYVSYRGKPDGDIRGVLAAWCADEYRLGDKGACTAELGTALKNGWLKGPNVWPQNRAYITVLLKTLAKWGYTS